MRLWPADRAVRTPRDDLKFVLVVCAVRAILCFGLIFNDVTIKRGRQNGNCDEDNRSNIQPVSSFF